MCGIAGLFVPLNFPVIDIRAIVRNMATQIMHRGPDDAGVWSDSSLGVALAHRRLSILDLSDAGHQPMKSHCGRYVIVFNGEIYNHEAIRREIEMEGYKLTKNGWNGHSDTETLLTAISFWGLERALKKCVGMFAFSLWDQSEKELFLVRDRLGEKPLYYGIQKGAFMFASELKALRAYPGFVGEVDRNSLALFLRRGMIPAPNSIYSGIFKLPAGSYLKVNLDDIADQKLSEPTHYWSMDEVALTGQSNLFQGTGVDAASEVERLLNRSIEGQMLADVPLGAFLSGGIDSTAIVALMQAQSAKRVKTFTVGFCEDAYNEAHHAKAISTYLGTEHTDLYVTPEHALSVIPKLPLLYDEPFADVSQIPTFLICELAHKHVKVCLSGDGGDEVFGGYNRHVFAPRIWRKISWLPSSIRTGLAALLTNTSPLFVDDYFKKLSLLLPKDRRYRSPGEKLHKLAELISAKSDDELYDKVTSQWQNPERVVIGSSASSSKNILIEMNEIEHLMMFLDTTSYLPDDVLVKVDRAAMGTSLETRVPMLDHRLVEFVWSLPLNMKIRGNQGKWLLRKVLENHVPTELVNRPKTGFGVPIDEWLRGPLREWAEELIDPIKLKKQGYFLTEPIGLIWKQHQQGNHNWSRQLWSVLMFQSWLEHNGG